MPPVDLWLPRSFSGSALTCHDCQLKQWNLLYFYQTTNTKDLVGIIDILLYTVYSMFSPMKPFLLHLKRADRHFLSLFLINFTLNMY